MKLPSSLVFSPPPADLRSGAQICTHIPDYLIIRRCFMPLMCTRRELLRLPRVLYGYIGRCPIWIGIALKIAVIRSCLVFTITLFMVRNVHILMYIVVSAENILPSFSYGGEIVGI